MKLFEQLEALSAEKQNNYWLGSAFWKQAQIFGDEGNQAASIRLFEKSLEAFGRDSDFAGTANHLLLLHNLFMNYENRGQRGESLRIHQSMEPATRLNLVRTSRLPADTPLFDLNDGQLLHVQNMAFIGILYATEIQIRFESGDDAGALELAQRIDRRLAGTTRKREVAILADILQNLAGLHLAAGDTAGAEQTLLRLIDLEKITRAGTYDEILGARGELAWLRCQQGMDPEPLLADVQATVQEARERRWASIRLGNSAKAARILAHSGDFLEARRIIDATVYEARPLDEPRLLADLLLTRAELQLDAGALDGVESDLFEALKWYRQRGGLRSETAAHVLYVRYLRAAGRTAEAHAALARAEARLNRFPNARQRAALSREALALTDWFPVGGERRATSDLQPVELTTLVAGDWSAKGRFTLTNPGDATIRGMLAVEGVALETTWDEARLEWQVRIRPDGTLTRARQAIVLQPLDQATIVLTADAVLARDGRVQLTWRGEADTQSAWWRFSQAAIDSDLAVIDANLAVENPFYSVPLHHYIVRQYLHASPSQNIRVITSAPCRVELIDPNSGRVLAIDATGDGDFRGPGDVIFADGNLDGFPDLRFEKSQRVGALEIQLYPLDKYDQVDVRLELQKKDGTWALKSTDRLVGRK